MIMIKVIWHLKWGERNQLVTKQHDWLIHQRRGGVLRLVFCWINTVPVCVCMYVCIISVSVYIYISEQCFHKAFFHTSKWWYRGTTSRSLTSNQYLMRWESFISWLCPSQTSEATVCARIRISVFLQTETASISRHHRKQLRCYWMAAIYFTGKSLMFVAGGKKEDGAHERRISDFRYSYDVHK